MANSLRFALFYPALYFLFSSFFFDGGMEWLLPLTPRILLPLILWPSSSQMPSFFSFLLVSTSIYPSIHPGMVELGKSSLIFKPGPDRWEGSSHGQIWLKNTSRRRNGMCKSLTPKWAWHVRRMKEDQIGWSTVAMKRLVYDEWRSGW